MNAIAPAAGPVVLAARDLGPYMMVLGIMILVLMVATVGLMWFRSRILSQSGETDQGAGLLQSLRAMRDRGEISIEEYDAARKAMAAKAAARRGEGDDPLLQKLSEAGIRVPPAELKAAAEARSTPKHKPQPGSPSVQGELRAKPGYDLTGRPLPGTPGPDSVPGGKNQGKSGGPGPG